MSRTAVQALSRGVLAAFLFGWATVSAGQVDGSPKERPTKGGCGGATLVINEAMTKNEKGLLAVLNADGDPSDWFEVQNITGAALNLSNYSFSDGTSSWTPSGFFIGSETAGTNRARHLRGKAV